MNGTDPAFTLDLICDEFERRWRESASPPALGIWLEKAPTGLHSRLLEALLPIDVEYRAGAGERPAPEGYHELPEQFQDQVEAWFARSDDSADSVDEVWNRPLRPQPGDHIGKYVLLKKIGEGGMGIVYLAQQGQERVALKLIKPGMDSESILARFKKERQTLALMDHPNIARVIDVGATESGQPYFAMELVEGVSLNLYCNENKLSIPERLELFLQICSAMTHAHQRGIIHRDLKPRNILVSTENGKPVPMVIDFGLAKALDSHATARSLFTTQGQLLGTLEYMSPEQASGRTTLDPRTDIYSLGIILYELLAGVSPLSKRRMRRCALDEVLWIIREERPPYPSLKYSLSDFRDAIARDRSIDPIALKIKLMGDLDWIILRALEKDRARRHYTVEALAEDIRRFLRNEPVRPEIPEAYVGNINRPGHIKPANNYDAPGAPGYITVPGKPRKQRTRLPELIILAAVLLLLGYFIGYHHAMQQSEKKSPPKGLYIRSPQELGQEQADLELRRFGFAR